MLSPPLRGRSSLHTLILYTGTLALNAHYSPQCYDLTPVRCTGDHFPHYHCHNESSTPPQGSRGELHGRAS